MGSTIPRYEDLKFTDDFLFCKVMQNNEDLCKELTELILDRPIGKIVSVAGQKPIEITKDGKGVRFDVFFKDDENTVYDIEMQPIPHKDLGLRSRYYQSMIDMQSLDRGAKYSELNNSYVIFITVENPFPEVNRHRYVFRNYCEEQKDLELPDRAQKVFLSAKGDGGISKSLQSLFTYMVENKVDDDFTERLNEAADKARASREWRAEYMTLADKLDDMREEGFTAGREEGLAQGRDEGFSEGGNNKVYELVENHKLSPLDGAENLHISLDQLKADMLESGHVFPEQ